jgi:hypothetical protein
MPPASEAPSSLAAAYCLRAKRALNAALYECMAEGTADVVISPLALLILGGAYQDGITCVFEPHMSFAHYQFDGLESGASYLGHPDVLKDEKILAYLRKKFAKRRFWDTVLTSHMVYPGPSFLQFLTALRQVMAILAKEPILVDTGQYRPKLQPRLYSDVEAEIARDLTNAPNYIAKVKIVESGEYVIRTKPAPETLSGTALAERIEAVKRQCRALGYTRHYTEVMEEIRKRQERWRGGAGPDTPQPPPPTQTGGATPPPAHPRGRSGHGSGSPPPTSTSPQGTDSL